MVLETPITSRAGFARLSSGGSANSSIRRRSLIPQSRVAGRVEVKSGEILCFLVKQFVYKTVPVLSTIYHPSKPSCMIRHIALIAIHSLSHCD